MPYIGYNVTNAGSFALIDDIASTFNGSNTAFTLQVGGVNITPNVQNLLIAIDGVVQQAPDAYSVSGSTITFTGAPASGADFYGVLMGQSSYVENNSITADELAVSGDGSSGQLLSSDGDGTFSYVNQSAVTADANVLSGTTLKSTVVNSSLTSVGTLTGLSVDNGTSSLNRGNSAGDILDVRGQNTSQMKVTTSAFTVTPEATFSGNLNVDGDTKRIYVRSNDYELVTVGMAGSSGSALDQGYLRMKSAGSNKIALHTAGDSYFMGGNIGVGHTTPQFGLTLLEGDLDANSIGWESSGNTKRGSIRMNPADYMKFNIGGGDRLWIGNATNNWAMNLTGNSPYGMQITTTSDGSSSHDAFVIKRASNTKVFEIFNNGDLTTYGGGTATFAGNITQSASTNLRHTMTAGGSGEASLVLTANNSTGDSFVRWETNSTTFCLGLDNSDGDKFILSAGSDPHSNSVINIQPDGSSIAVDKKTSFGDRIDFTGKPNIGNRVHSVSISSGSSSTYNMNGAGGNCSGGFIVGACHRDTSITADNSVCIYAHVHTQGANVYSTIIERNDDSDVTITRSGGQLTCTNNGNSTVNFVVKYILLTAFDTSNNLV